MMWRNRTHLAAMAGTLLGVMGAVALAAQDRPGQGGPPPEMLQACVGKSAGMACSVTGSQDQITGVCFAPQGRPLACRPDGMPPQVPATTSSVSGPKVSTAAVLCRTAIDAPNASLGIRSVSRWTCAGGLRTLGGNGIPNHPADSFPNANNPNRLSAQTVAFSTTLRPGLPSGSGSRVRIPGYALNGVRFDPGTGGRCASGVSGPNDCTLDRGAGEWVIEALGQTSFNFGVDANNAHVQPDGAYHYHGVPEGMLSTRARAGQAMALVGWAGDGFPIYARFGHADPGASKSGLRVMRSSYRLKSTPDPGRPAVGVVPMGTFMQDYSFAKGSGDLDECNGRFGVTPEFPKGIYHYYATDNYPYIQRCVKGVSANAGREGPPPR